MMYREDLVSQIAEAERALIALQSNNAAIIGKQNSVKKDIDKNKVRKTEIQLQLAANAAQLQQLDNHLIDLNLKEQEASRGDIVNMRISLESVKERMNKIE